MVSVLSPRRSVPALARASEAILGCEDGRRLKPSTRVVPGLAFALLKEKILGSRTVSLDLSEVLICLSISAGVNPAAQLALEKLKDLHGCEVHMTHIPTPGDDAGLRKLGVNLTTDTDFSTRSLFVR